MTGWNICGPSCTPFSFPFTRSRIFIYISSCRVLLWAISRSIFSSISISCVCLLYSELFRSIASLLVRLILGSNLMFVRLRSEAFFKHLFRRIASFARFSHHCVFILPFGLLSQGWNYYVNWVFFSFFFFLSFHRKGCWRGSRRHRLRWTLVYRLALKRLRSLCVNTGVSFWPYFQKG